VHSVIDLRTAIGLINLFQHTKLQRLDDQRFGGCCIGLCHDRAHRFGHGVAEGDRHGGGGRWAADFFRILIARPVDADDGSVQDAGLRPPGAR
jgi:hypothetical protein